MCTSSPKRRRRTLYEPWQIGQRDGLCEEMVQWWEASTCEQARWDQSAAAIISALQMGLKDFMGRHRNVET